jgi:hypothetical protein
LLLADQGADTMPVQSLEFDEEGVAKVPAVAPGRYVVYVLRGSAAGTVGRVEAVVPPGEIRVPLAEPKTLRVRVSPANATRLMGAVLSPGGGLAALEVVEDGVLGSPGLPPGRYPVKVFGRDGERELEGRAVVETGVEASVALEPVQ